jgi:hypothetical protein
MPLASQRVKLPWISAMTEAVNAPSPLRYRAQRKAVQ